MKLWGIVHKLKFKTCEVLEVYCISEGFNKIFMGSVFFGVTLHFAVPFSRDRRQNKYLAVK